MPSRSPKPVDAYQCSAKANSITDLLGILDELSGGVHPGFRPAHAKGLVCIGTFSPSPEAAGLTRALHATRPSTSVTVRYSDSTGIPTIPYGQLSPPNWQCSVFAGNCILPLLPAAKAKKGPCRAKLAKRRNLGA
jgi:hypothetical protein